MRTLHLEGIAHGDLKPSNIYHFFAENTWKILETDTVFVEGRPPPVHYTSTPEYAAPEVLFAEFREAVVPVTTDADIYSLGIILYELFQGMLPSVCRIVARSSVTAAGTRFYPPEMSHEVIYVCAPIGKLPSNTSCIENDAIRNMIDNCIRLTPSQRWTAAEMCDAEIFRPVREAAASASLQENLVCQRPNTDKGQTLAGLKHQPFQVHPASVEEPIPADVDISLCLEEFAEGNPSGNLADVKGLEVLTARDSQLEGQTIFLLNEEQKAYLLRMVVDSVAFDRTPSFEIVRMGIVLTDNHPVELQMSAATTAFQHEAVAILRIEDLVTRDVWSTSACSHRSNGEYLEPELVVNVRIPSTARTTSDTFTIRGKIYGKLVQRDARKLNCPTNTALLKTSRYTPRWARFTVKRSRFSRSTAIWESVSY